MVSRPLSYRIIAYALIICLYSYNLMGYYHRFLYAIPLYEVGLLPITHPSAGRHQYTRVYHAAPQLACIKPAASVHPEPGSNSPYFLSCTSSWSSSSLAFVKLFFPLLLSSPQFTSLLFFLSLFSLLFHPTLSNLPPYPLSTPPSLSSIYLFPLFWDCKIIYFFSLHQIFFIFFKKNFFTYPIFCSTSSFIYQL